ncbi:cytochrome c [Flavobacteriaceae bacterium S0825]|uniref:c-type cytochrome n=1 Tax=Gaetbulibacter sp. S0825 TaxID=2720084 RepID=UPI00142FD881|nr:cytochrome c [Gaetbulibacter sp. S0825]MCK0108433.1 cytochrome c [Flavobacteriaceae bacterium S0825]NIX64069.1 cytochrome c [Gaetbulibacter sp. S0825]
MKSTLKILTLVITLFALSCGGGEEKKEEKTKVQLKRQPTTKKVESKSNDTKPSETIDLTNKGVGPITSMDISAPVDEAMVAKGKEVFDKMCTACHRVGKKFIGPAPNGILERRTPEWVMNMILDPEGMTQKDPLAKALLMEFNGSPMANQSLTEDEARGVLEYFRTLK